MEAIHYWRNVTRRLLAALDRQLQKPWWKCRAVILSWIVATFFCSPSAYEFLRTDWRENQQAAVQKIEHPFRDMSDYPPESTQSKRTFRITVPLIAHLLGLDIIWVYVLQWICGFLLLAVTVRMVHEWFQDRLTAFLATLYLAAVYPGSAAFLEYWSLFDAFAYLFLLLAFYFSSPALIGALVLVAAYTDERALIASPAIILFHAIRLTPRDSMVRPVALLNYQTAAVVIGWAFYFIIRSYLASAYDLTTSTGGVGLSSLLNFRQLHVGHIGIWGAFEAGWLFFPLALTELWIRRERWLAVLWAISLSISLLTAILVQDITRSASYLIGSLLLAWLILSRGSNPPMEPSSPRRLFAVMAAVSLLMLGYRVFGTVSTPVPLPTELAKTIYLLRQPNKESGDLNISPRIRNPDDSIPR